MKQQLKADSITEQQFKTGPIMAALLVAGFVGLFSETALNIALGDLSQIFHTNATTIQWLATGYFLTLGILVPVTGILMQKFTTRQMFLTSILLSIIGTILVAISYLIYAQFGTETALWMIVGTHIVMMLGIGAVLASTQTNTLNSLPKQYYPDGIAITQTIQQVAGAIGIAVMVSLLSAKQNNYLATVENELTEATAAGSSLVFYICLILAVINFVLSLFIKKPNDVKLKS